MADTTITSVRFNNYKALDLFSVSLDRMNLLVGPNNCGKSTILSAFRVLNSGLRRARARTPDVLQGPDGHRRGYELAQSTLPISVENVHTDYREEDTTLLFRLSNGNRLQIYFPPDGGCRMFALTEGKTPKSTTDFKNEFPISVGVVPVLGPVEHEEDLLSEDYVRRSLNTRRASLHFRNYWYHFPDGFDEFAEMVATTWPGMEIDEPEKPNQLAQELVMFCREHRMTRELYWAGFGFQVWCQMLTHVSRADSENDTILVIDEPEIYLHPDVQRQLLGILRAVSPDVIAGTHSTEIMGEADPSEILLIEKSEQSARRLRDVEGVQTALDSIGSVQNITLTRLARNRNILFTESSQDFKILRRFAQRLNLDNLAASRGITDLEAGGFESWEKIQGLAWGFKDALGGPIHMAAVFDRDYWPEEKLDEIRAKLSGRLEIIHFHDRKEIENYLLDPQMLERATERAIANRVQRTGDEIERTETAREILDEISRKYRSAAQGQYIARRQNYFDGDRRDNATITSETIEWFEAMWSDIDSRMKIVPGKTVLSDYRTYVQEEFSVSVTDYSIIDEFDRGDIPADLRTLVNELENFAT